MTEHIHYVNTLIADIKKNNWKALEFLSVSYKDLNLIYSVLYAT